RNGRPPRKRILPARSSAVTEPAAGIGSTGAAHPAHRSLARVAGFRRKIRTAPKAYNRDGNRRNERTSEGTDTGGIARLAPKPVSCTGHSFGIRHDRVTFPGLLAWPRSLLLPSLDADQGAGTARPVRDGAPRSQRRDQCY